MGGKERKKVENVQITVLLKEIVIFSEANDKESDGGWGPANDVRDNY